MWAKRYTPTFLVASLAVCLCLVLLAPLRVSAAINPLPIPQPGSGSYGLEATKKQPPPTQGATITVPGNGASYSTSPITVSGLCLTGLLVQVYDNGVLAGSIDCKDGSFSIQISLFVGQNDITASVFDDLDQPGPASNTATVTYSNANFSAFGTLITLTSNYGRRAANPGTELTWPLLLSGGSGPYAFSIDWGDGTPSQLKSQSSAGEVDLAHTYKQSGLYHVVVKVTDVNGVTAFLQVTAIANGKVNAADAVAATTKTVTITKIVWIPVAIAFAMLFPTYWFGRKSQLVSLHKKLQKRTEDYKEL